MRDILAAKRRIIEAFNKGNLEIIDEFISKNYIYHGPADFGEIIGPEGLKAYMKSIPSFLILMSKSKTW